MSSGPGCQPPPRPSPPNSDALQDLNEGVLPNSDLGTQIFVEPYPEEVSEVLSRRSFGNRMVVSSERRQNTPQPVHAQERWFASTKPDVWSRPSLSALRSRELLRSTVRLWTKYARPHLPPRTVPPSVRPRCLLGACSPGRRGLSL